jgi:hypothetical protein
MVKKSGKPAIKIIESNDNKMKFQCELCKEGNPHLICIMNKDGEIHVHGPMENRYLLNQMIEAIISEQNKFNSKKE